MSDEEDDIFRIKLPTALLQDKRAPELTTSEIREFLKDYKLLEAADYEKVKPGTLICYYNYMGKFTRGGIITRNLYPHDFQIRKEASNFFWTVSLKTGNIFYIKEADKDLVNDTKLALDIYEKLQNEEYVLLEKKQYEKMIKKINKKHKN